MATFRKKALGIGSAGIIAASAIATPFIGGWEGLSLKAYLDPIGIPTICRGETKDVYIGQVKTLQECDDMTKARVREFTAQVAEAITVPVPETRLAAFTSFAYNAGINAFRGSSMLKKLNAGDAIGACNGLTSWVCVTVKPGKGVSEGVCTTSRRDKKPLRGLVKRRAAERELCLQGEI